jgi:hypothetical protein
VKHGDSGDDGAACHQIGHAGWTGKLVTPEYDGLPACFHGAGLLGEGLVAAGSMTPVGSQNCVMYSDLQYLDHVRVALVPASLW